MASISYTLKSNSTQTTKFTAEIHICKLLWLTHTCNTAQPGCGATVYFCSLTWQLWVYCTINWYFYIAKIIPVLFSSRKRTKHFPLQLSLLENVSLAALYNWMRGKKTVHSAKKTKCHVWSPLRKELCEDKDKCIKGLKPKTKYAHWQYMFSQP